MLTPFRDKFNEPSPFGEEQEETEMSYEKELQSALQGKVTEYKAAVAAMEQNTIIDGENVDVPVKEYKAAMALQQEMAHIVNLIEAKGYGEQMASYASDPVAPPVAFGARQQSQSEQKSIGAAFIESAEFKAMNASGQYKMDSPWQVRGGDLAAWGQKDVYTGMASPLNVDVSVGNRIQHDPMLPRPQLLTRVRDLFPAARTSANLITYIRSEGFVENGGRGNAQAVPDWDPGEVGPPAVPAGFGVKPRSNLRFSAQKAPVETIAHWETVHRNILQDLPQLEATINNELMYGLKLAEDDQILNGSGLDSNLLGLLNTPNVQTHTRAVGDSYADALRRAATKCLLAFFPATAYVLHPNDWETTELTKATGDGQYVLFSNVSVGAQKQVWRLPVVETPAITEGTFLAGAFGLGAQLYDRQEANIRISESHGNLFVQNAIAILAEERLALAVKRPEAFVIGDFTP